MTRPAWVLSMAMSVVRGIPYQQPGWLVVLALLEVGIPFPLISAGEQRIPHR